MSDWANLSGVRIVSGTVTLPYYRLWSADVVLALTDSVAAGGAQVTLTLGDLSLVGTIVRAASFSGSRSARIVGGYGGWRKTVPARSYSNAAGVALSLVLRDLALDAGEQVNIAADASIGTAYARQPAQAQRVLEQFAPCGWWVDAAGVTQVGARASSPIASAFDVVSYSGGKGTFTIATEVLADWVPGRTFTAPTVTTGPTIAAVIHTIEGSGKARTEAVAA